MKNLVKYVVATGTALALLVPFPVQALRKTYDFELINLTGPLAGENLGGWFSFDDENMKGEGFEFTSGNCLTDCSNSSSEFDSGLLFNFDFMGNLYTNDDEKGDMPIIYFKDGNPSRIYYRAANYAFQFSALGGTDANGNALGLRIFEYYLDAPNYGGGNGNVVFIGENGERYYSFNPPRYNSSDVRVPEPSILSGFGLLALLGIAAKVRRAMSS